MTALASEDFWAEYQLIVNDDEEMRQHGRDDFDTNFMLGIGQQRFFVEVQNGRIEDVRSPPGFDDAWDFGILGPREAWEKFTREVPPPHHNDVVASVYRSAVRQEEGYFQLVGNFKTVFQNFRSVQRALNLMREVPTEGDA